MQYYYTLVECFIYTKPHNAMLNWKNTYLVEKVIATDIDLQGDRNKITIPLKHFVWK